MGIIQIFVDIQFGSTSLINNIFLDYIWSQFSNFLFKLFFRVLYSLNPVQIIERVLTYNPTLTIAIQCYGVDVVDSYCGLSNYYIVVHYCKPYCNLCTSESTCDQWTAYNPSVVKVEQSQCLSNQFLDETTSTCEDCPNECLTCFNEYECLTCQPNYRLVFNTCILNCQLNQYYDGTSCLNCDYSCKQCQSSNYCIHCETKYLRYLENGQCLCYDGYYNQNNIQQCQPCDKLCSKCSGPTNKNCQACKVQINLILNGNTCECSNGYYFDEYQLKCLTCSQKCENCFGSSDSSCLSCHSTQFRVLDGFDCKCQLGYYDNGSDACIQCPAVEDSSFTFCYKICGNGISIWFNQNCPTIVCPSGYNNVNNQCIPICGDLQLVVGEQCDDGNLILYDGCHNCRFQCPAQCTVCNSTTVFPCLDICGDGIISGLEECDDSNSVQFDGCYQCRIECQPQCTRCNKGICTECLYFGWTLDPYKRECIESCGDKIYVGNEQCEDMNTLMLDGCYNCRLSCQQSCLTCTNNGCTLCKDGFRLVSQYCRNICGDSIVVEGEDCDDGNQFAFDGCHQCVYQCQTQCLHCLKDIREIPKIPFQEQYKPKIIEFCKISIEGICQECQKGYLLHQNVCQFQKRYEIIKLKVLDALPQFIQFCYFQLNNQCIICDRNFELDIFTNTCIPICGDGIISGTEECEDQNWLALDGCYQCKYQCSSNCDICDFGKCILCEMNKIIVPATFQCEFLELCTQPGSYYNQDTNQCYSICGDGFIYQREEYQITCELGLYYSFASQSCRPQCGDGIIVYPFEECDDSNDITDDECHLCKLQCGVNCLECSPQNICLECVQDYELVNMICYEQTNACGNSGCNLCENDSCFTCFTGYYLINDMCYSQCGDGIMTDLEECDDGNLLNGDGCDNDCTESENSTCKDNECVILSSTYSYLEYEKEQSGVQYIKLKYSTMMRLIDGFTQQDYLDNLKFEIDNQTDVAFIQIIPKLNITHDLQFVDIQVAIEFIKYCSNPILKLRFIDQSILVNQDGAEIQQDILRIKLLSSNFLKEQEQKVIKSLIGLNDYILKFAALLIAISSLSGQSEIISNLLDTIQQLYYLKYINSRIGVNLQKYYETFQIIQLTNFFDFLGINPNRQMSSIVSFYHSEPVFESDDRNANYLNNIAQLILAYLIFFPAYFCFKKVAFYFLKKIDQLTGFYSNHVLVAAVSAVQKLCLRIQMNKLIDSIQAIFLTMIYEFGINIFLALKYQKSDSEGQLGVSIAILILYGVILVIISNTSFSIQIAKTQQLSSQKNNSFTYLCMQKLFFISFIIFFFESSQIQILLCLLNEFQYIYFLYIRKIQMLPSENFKQFTSHLLQFIILGMYLVNDFYQYQADVLIIIGWNIIGLMSTILFMTLIIDLIKIIHPIWQKCKASKTSELSNSKQEIFCIVENPCNPQRRFTV
ncbi:unnamed protein product [Paramecium octaurelia]|uniref:EGF-like domain-containing protein n=1 Tax=Paramecium octaurelia TaxID=43137 RepID=A0A8S1T965_PAROT|nr:unnamed protein product [Paramecium octaurelia]